MSCCYKLNTWDRVLHKETRLVSSIVLEHSGHAVGISLALEKAFWLLFNMADDVIEVMCAKARAHVGKPKSQEDSGFSGRACSFL